MCWLNTHLVMGEGPFFGARGSQGRRTPCFSRKCCLLWPLSWDLLGRGLRISSSPVYWEEACSFQGSSELLQGLQEFFL